MKPPNFRGRLQSICALGASLAISLIAQGAEPEAIQADIDYLLGGLGRKADLQERIAGVVKHGPGAVPILITRYSRTEQEKRWPLAACLCLIPTAESLDFLKRILRSHEDRQALSEIIRRFPLEQEGQITLLLVDLLGIPPESVYAQEIGRASCRERV
jgi:hypothetical protein